MMIENSERHILVVDDNRPIGVFVKTVLGKCGYNVTLVESGEACLEMVGTLKPHAIFLDIEMPGMNGYDTCLHLRQREDVYDTPVIFASGHDSVEDRVKAYEVGADDFVAKPLNAVELQQKATIAMRLYDSRNVPKAPPSTPPELLNTAMESLREANVALAFMRGTLNCRSLEALARLVVQSMGSYGITAQVQLRSDIGNCTFTPRGVASPLEELIFDQMRGQGRQFQFRKRLIVNYDKCSLLITDMPDENPDLNGRIRDYAAMLAEAADAAVENIALRINAVQRANTLRELAQACRDVITSLRENYRGQQIEVHTELDAMVTNIEDMYYKLGLTDKQEGAISDTTRASVQSVRDILARGQSFDVEFSGLLNDLTTTLDGMPVESEDGGTSGDDELWF